MIIIGKQKGDTIKLSWNLNKMLDTYYQLLKRENKTADDQELLKLYSGLLKLSNCHNFKNLSWPILEDAKESKLTLPDCYIETLAKNAKNNLTKEVHIKSTLINEEKLLEESFAIFGLINPDYQNDIKSFLKKDCFNINQSLYNKKVLYYDKVNCTPLLYFTINNNYEDYMAFQHEVAHMLDILITREINDNLLKELRPIFASFLSVEYHYHKEHNREYFKTLYNYYAYIEDLLLKVKTSQTRSKNVLKEENNSNYNLNNELSYIVSFYLALHLFKIYQKDPEKAFELYNITRKRPNEELGFYQDLLKIANFERFLEESIQNTRKNISKTRFLAK